MNTLHIPETSVPPKPRFTSIQWFSLLALLVLVGASASSLFTWPASLALASGSAELDQCRNGTFSNPQECKVNNPVPNTGWVNGNSGGSNSHWAEGQSVPFRMLMPAVTPGTHVLEIQYDYTASTSEHAYDYLTSYNRTETTADACAGFLASCPTPATFPIPVDPVLATCTTPYHAAGTGGVPQVPGNFSIYNGTITSAAYHGTHTCEGKSVQVNMVITFTVPVTATTDVVIAWGAHVAAEFDWGRGDSAHTINGSPYHMAEIALDGSGGNQDRSMSTDTIYSTDLSTTVQTGGTPHIGKAVQDVAHVTGYLGPKINTNPAILGSLNFYICSDTTVPFQPPFPNGCDPSSGTLISQTSVPVNGNGDYTSASFIPTQNGYYCFRSEFTPAAGSPYPFSRETNALTSGTTAECFLVTDPTAVSLVNLQAGSNPSGLPVALFTGGLGLMGLVAVFIFKKKA
ncbi:MAG TPA: hypothetical protein VF823_03665 [Anaerolineales bacterium]